MSKNITIQEGGIAKQLTVDKLKTNLVNSGSCLWVPEDEVQLTTKTITENGTYKASDDGYYGYSQVTVSVSGVGTATGTDGDGDEAVAHTDPGTGELVTDKVPSNIRVITPPTNPYGIYQNGQAIVTDGMVVKAYLQTGGKYGTVPNGEITLNPTTAVYDKSTDTPGMEGDIDPSELEGHYDLPLALATVAYGYYKTPENDVTIEISSGYGCVIRNGMYAVSDSPFSLTFTWYDNDVAHTGNNSTDTPTYDPTVAPITWYGIAMTFPNFTMYSANNIPNTNKLLRDLARICYGDGTITHTQAGSHQQIGVSWPRPLDGKVLETTFEILVAPPYSDGSEE